MLQQNIIQVFENNSGDITIAKGEFIDLKTSVSIGHLSFTVKEAREVAEALLWLSNEIENSQATGD
jgi:hypothetical protein